MQIDDMTWQRVKSRCRIGQVILCRVQEHRPFGILVLLGDEPVWGVVERIGMSADGFNTPDDYPVIGCRIELEVLGFREHSRQVELKLPRKK